MAKGSRMRGPDSPSLRASGSKDEPPHPVKRASAEIEKRTLGVFMWCSWTCGTRLEKQVRDGQTGGHTDVGDALAGIAFGVGSAEAGDREVHGRRAGKAHAHARSEDSGDAGGVPGHG